MLPVVTKETFASTMESIKGGVNSKLLRTMDYINENNSIVGSLIKMELDRRDEQLAEKCEYMVTREYMIDMVAGATLSTVLLVYTLLERQAEADDLNAVLEN